MDITNLESIMSILVKIEIAGRLYDHRMIQRNDYEQLLLNTAVGIGLVNVSNEAEQEAEPEAESTDKGEDLNG